MRDNMALTVPEISPKMTICLQNLINFEKENESITAKY